MSERSGIFRKTLSALKEIWSLLPAVCSACNMHFFGHQVLILFWTHLPCFFSTLSVCMPGLFCSAAFWLVRIAYCGRLGRGAEKNRAIKRFRNRAISNRDFISISINRTALLCFFTKVVCNETNEDNLLKKVVFKLEMHRLRSGHFLWIGYWSDKTDPNLMLCVYYSVLLLSPTKAQKHDKAP